MQLECDVEVGTVFIYFLLSGKVKLISQGYITPQRLRIHTYIHTLHKLYLTRDPISWLATSRSRPFPCAQTYMFVAGLIWSIYDI